MFLLMSLPAQENRQDRKELERTLGALAAGRREALHDLYEQCAQAVFAYALSLLRNTHDAEDVLHACILKVWETAPGYAGRGKPMAWILTIARNLCYSKLRADKKSVPLPDGHEPAYDEGLPAEERMLLNACMDSLKETERQIVVLHAVSGLKHREIAKMLDMPLGTVLSQYRRAIAKLRKLYEQGGSE